MRRSSSFLLVAALAACDVGPGTPRSTSDINAPAPGASEIDRPHVVFTRESFVIERVGVAVAPPVTTPSQPSQLTLESDDPTTVAVDGSGRLVGIRPGSTVIRATGGGSSLAVTVVGARELRLVPEQIALAPGGEGRVKVLREDGVEVAPELVRWSIEAGTPVGVVRGRVLSTGGTGRFEVAAEVGGARVVLPVLVEVPGGSKLTVSPPRARLRRGQVSAFQLLGSQGGVRAEWTSSAPDVLAAVGGGLFHAVKVGRARACAAALERVSCSDVEVSP